MHLVIGFLMASILRRKAPMQTGMPSVRGKLEVVHALPGRVRFSSSLLEGLQAETRNKIGMEMHKVDGIERVEINGHTGSLLVIYDPPVVQPFIVHGIVVKLLGLEQELEKPLQGRLTGEVDLFLQSVNRQIVQSSGGLIDLHSSLMLTVLTTALYRIFIQGERSLPGGINLLWWAYVITNRGK